MPDYIYLLESRLSPEQRAVLERVQELSRSQDLNIYLSGGAVRDLISGQPIRDLDFTVEGNPVKMVRELEKGGAKVVWESEKLRHYETIFAGDVDGSISGARDDVYERPGAKVEHRFSSIMEDLRRRDFSINAIAISLNTQSRGLLLDPTNGLADLEKQEVRALSIHAFTNQPVRLMRILRYCARMGFKMEQRTQEWFDLAMERKLNENIGGPEAGSEVRSLSREDLPAATLKQWEAYELLAPIHPQLQKRKPDYEKLNKLAKVRMNLAGVGLRPRVPNAVIYYTLGKLKDREATAAMRAMEFRTSEIGAIEELAPEAEKIVKVLKGRKTNAPRDAYFFVAGMNLEQMAFIEVEMPNPKVMQKLRNYVQKWRPLRLALPTGELDALGVARGPKFDKIIEDLFEMQLRGKGRDVEQRAKILRKLAGIKEEPKKKPEKEKEKKAGKGKTGGEVVEAKAETKPPAKAKAAVAVGGSGARAESKESRAGDAAAITARAQDKHAKFAAAGAAAKARAGRAAAGEKSGAPGKAAARKAGKARKSRR
jgi:tRNA nucleotidyltransferase (CCA-adding enzyme)